MKTLIYFNSPDKPINMGQSQLVDSLDSFLKDSELENVTIESDKIIFTKFVDEQEVKGYAMVFQVPDDFQN